MSIEISCETLLSLNEAARRLPGRPNISTLHRWRLNGVHGVRLETCLIGGRRFTSHEALERFANATTAAADRTPVPPRTPLQRQRAIDAAEKAMAQNNATKNSRNPRNTALIVTGQDIHNEVTTKS
ncbi:MAG: DUF1580 domain-containing protein [Planctomycetota bacterium]